MISFLRRFLSWRWCGTTAAFFTFVTIVARSQDPVFHTAMASLAGVLAGLTAVLFFHERVHRDEVWVPSPEVCARAERFTKAAQWAAAGGVMMTIAAWVHPQWHNHFALPILLAFPAYVQKCLLSTSKKEPIWTR